MSSTRNPTPVAVALVRVNDPRGMRLLAMRRREDPIDGWAFPAGYVENFEDAGVAACREVGEETGIVIPTEGWKVLRVDTTPRNKMLVFMLSSTILKPEDLEAFVPNAEASAIASVGAGDALCFPLHQAMLDSNAWHGDQKIYAVLSLRSGYAREDPSSAQILGAYTDPEMAKVVAQCLHGHVAEVELNAVPKGVLSIAEALCIRIPPATV